MASSTKLSSSSELTFSLPSYSFHFALAMAEQVEAVWVSFLNTVDETPLGDSDIKKIAQKLIEAGLRAPSDLTGVTELEIAEAVGGNIGQKAFARRALRHHLAATEPQKETVQKDPKGPVMVDPDLVELMGSEASAAAVAAAIAVKGDLPDIQGLLKTASCEGLPYELQAENQLWAALAADTAAAQKTNRTAFTYVDLTAKQVLPVWLPADAVGGKSVPISEELWDTSRTNSSIAQLGAALRAVTQSPRCFRSVAQWSACFWRYAPVAVAVKQLTWSMVLTHHATIIRLAEELRLTEGESIIAILYDQLRRQQWAKRAAQRDPRLNLEEEVGKVDEQIFLAARTRLELITKKGISDKNKHGGNSSGAESSGGYPAQAMAAESALAKSVSAAQTITRRAEQAAKAMADHQAELNKREKAMQQDKSDSDKGKGKNKSQRQDKRRHWWSGKGADKKGRH